MANKRITDLSISGDLRGDENFIIDQVTPTCISGLDTVRTDLTKIQSFVITDAPFFCTTGDINVTGCLNVTENIGSRNLNTSNNITAAGDISTCGRLISGGIDVTNLINTGLSGLGNLQQITDNGNTTTNMLSVDNTIAANKFDIPTGINSIGYISGGQNLTDIFITQSTGSGNIDSVLESGNTTSRSLSVGNISAAQIIGNAFSNTVLDSNGFIGGGLNSAISGANSSIVGGNNNTIFLSASNSFIGGGSNNQIVLSGSSITGGRWNRTGNTDSAIGGGTCNCTTSARSTIGGGHSNSAAGIGSTIGGGVDNASTGQYNVIGGG